MKPDSPCQQDDLVTLSTVARLLITIAVLYL